MPIQIGRRPDHGVDRPLGMLTDCHRRIEYFLDVLVALDQRCAGGPLTPGQRAELDAALAYFATAAPNHTSDEEESLFPRLRALDDGTARRIVDTIGRLEGDHEQARQHHLAIDTSGRRWLADGSLTQTAAAAFGGHLEALQALYRLHIGVEDRELFPAAARLLSSAQLTELGREMAQRRRP
jgi:hemerythrin-like domain-containing protein